MWDDKVKSVVLERILHVLTMLKFSLNLNSNKGPHCKEVKDVYLFSIKIKK